MNLSDLGRGATGLERSPDWNALCLQLAYCLRWYEFYCTSFIDGTFDGGPPLTGVRRALADVDMRRIQALREEVEGCIKQCEQQSARRRWRFRFDIYDGGKK